MNEIQALIDAVRAAGASIRTCGLDLLITPAGRVPSALKSRLRDNKDQILRRLQLEENVRRLQEANVLLAVSDDGDLRIVVTDADAHQAAMDSFTIYSPEDAYMYVTLSESERKLLHDFTRAFGGIVEWRSE